MVGVLILLALVALLVLGWAWGPLCMRWLQAADTSLAAGDRQRALRLCARVRGLGTAPQQVTAALLEARALTDEGLTARAIETAREMLAFFPTSECPWPFVNQAVVSLVNAGLYTEALGVAQRWPECVRSRDGEVDPASCAITRINEAEALHNLGRVDEALRALDAVQCLAACDPVAASGLTCLRAWILVSAGRVDAARSVLDGADLAALSPVHDAEVAYTWAALERDAGDLATAMRHAERGLAAARTASSERNGLFMVAGIAALQGDESRARDLFERAVNHAYRAQAGDGLSRYARFLEGLGDRGGADRARAMIAERDPEWRPPDRDNGA